MTFGGCWCCMNFMNLRPDFMWRERRGLTKEVRHDIRRVWVL